MYCVCKNYLEEIRNLEAEEEREHYHVLCEDQAEPGHHGPGHHHVRRGEGHAPTGGGHDHCDDGPDQLNEHTGQEHVHLHGHGRRH